MARNSRQSKILELIAKFEIETQDDLVSRLRASQFDVTQATVSRDIKELGLIKILSADSGNYKYALAETNQISSRYIYLFRDAVVGTRPVQNFVILKTLKGFASGICSIVDKIGIEDLLGATFGEDTVVLVFADSFLAQRAITKLDELLS